MAILTILILMFSILGFTSYRVFRKNLLSPTLISSLIFIVGIIFTIIINFKHKQTIYFELLAILMLGILSMFIGEIISYLTTDKKHFNLKRVYYFKLSLLTHLVLLSISIITVYFSYIQLIDVAKLYGYSGTGSILAYARSAKFNLDYESNYIVSLLGFFTKSLAYMGIFAFFNNVILGIKKKSNFLFLLYSIPTIALYILSTGRNEFILFVVYAISSYIIINIYYNKKIKLKKQFGWVIIGVLFFFSAFSIIGDMLNKTGESNFQVISQYGGSSIIAFNNYINNYTRSSYFGYETFVGIRDLLNRFIPSIEPGYKFLEFTYINGESFTNIYTSFRAYLNDFGIIGLVTIQFLLGFILSKIIYKVPNHKNMKPIISIFPIFVYFLVYQLFTPSITTTILGVQYTFIFFFMYLIHKRLVATSISWEVYNERNYISGW